MNIKMLIMDVDGTLTDGKIYYSSKGEEMKSFNVKDGYAIKQILPKLNIIPVIITGRHSNIVEVRAKELDIFEVYQGVISKIEIYDLLKKKYNLNDSNVAFIGDDLNDLELFQKCGITACPQDATSIIKDRTQHILSKKGGEGAVQEFILELLDGMLIY